MTTIINADNGVVSGVSGLKYSADNSGILVLQTNGTTALTIDTSQNVTFAGTVNFATAAFTNLSYTGTLTGGTGVVNLGAGQFYKDASGNVIVGGISAINSAANRGNITVNGSSTAIISLGVGGVSKGYIYTQGTDIIANADTGAFTVQTSASQPVIFATNAAERMRISSTGNVGIGTTTPAAQLEIAGYPNATFRIGDGGTGYYQFTRQASDGYLHQNSNFNTTGFIWEIAASEKMRIDSSGNLLVNRTSRLNNGKLEVLASTSEQAIVSQVQSNGNSLFQGFNASGTVQFQVTGTAGVYIASLGTGLVYSNGGTLTSTNPSDSRLKTNIQDIAWGLKQINELRPVAYDLKTDTINQGTQYGFIAQEVQEVMPELIKTFIGEDEVEYLGLDKEGIYATLVKAIQELNAKVEALEAQLAAK